MPEIDVEVVISPQPKDGLSRHLGGLYKANGTRDNEAIANALFDIAKQLGVSHPAEQRQEQMREALEHASRCSESACDNHGTISRGRYNPETGYVELEPEQCQMCAIRQAALSTTPTTRYVRAEELERVIVWADEPMQCDWHDMVRLRGRLAEIATVLKSLRGEK